MWGPISVRAIRLLVTSEQETGTMKSAVTGHMVAIRKLIEQFGLDDRDVQACARNAEILIRHDREVIA